VISGFVGFVRKIAHRVRAVSGGDGTFASQSFTFFSSRTGARRRRTYLKSQDRLLAFSSPTGLVDSPAANDRAILSREQTVVLLWLRIVPHTCTDQEKLGVALGHLMADDRSLAIRSSAGGAVITRT
jgi:hypothetical protein